ncbi:hypothetical protein Bealeia1_01588 [Candidatus Bealeia paramacronuclearis]|uniref:DUF3035 domain-containing protein n=2 Tax=Candidatus Bealeia paramacronuclearis TaxID=1921001 RepID=A0ABZ2C4I1_9PROT|nr:hypothetical protein [Candidatus Bealeia paramacronuclearis]
MRLVFKNRLHLKGGVSMIELMKIKELSILIMPLALTGCIAGTVISGEHRLLREDFPDVRTVPTRAEATKARSYHGSDEKGERTADFKELEQERTKQQARDQELRSLEVELPPIPEIPPLDLEELDETLP